MKSPISLLATSNLCLFSVITLMSITLTAQEDSIQNSIELRSYGEYNLFAWETGWNYNKSSYTRSWGGNEGANQLDYYWLGFDQSETRRYVGLDYGVGLSTSSKKVKGLSSTSSSKVGATMEFLFMETLKPRKVKSRPQFNGYWYMGPKTIISKTKNYNGLEGDNYECYIIEKSSLSPKKLRKTLNSGGKLIFQGSSNHWDGEKNVKYNHYSRPFNGFTQVWTIRTSWKDAGEPATSVSTQVNWIQHIWMENGIVPRNHYNLGWKTNIEFAGRFKNGNCSFSFLNLPRN